MNSFWSGFYKEAKEKEEQKPVSMKRHIGTGAAIGAVPGAALLGLHASEITGPNVKWGRTAKPRGLKRLGYILGSSALGAGLGAIPGAAAGTVTGLTAKQLEKRRKKKEEGK